MTRQQAGVSALTAEQVQRACVPLLETDALLTLIPWRQITQRLNEALATAPPEQAAPLREEEVHNAYLLSLTSQAPSQGGIPPYTPAVSAGALRLREAVAKICWNWHMNMSNEDLDALIEANLKQLLAAHDQKVGEPLAAWMIENSFATGHGDTVEDLLKELKWQIEERDQKVRREVLEEAARYMDDWHSEADLPFAGDCIRKHFGLSGAAPAPAASKPEATKEP